MPFTSLRLKAPRPRCHPRGYPTAPRALGEHLRKCRLDRGLGQRTVAESLGVREETVHLRETGRARPLPGHHAGIIRFLGYDPDGIGPTLAGRLRAVRRRLGLTQAEFAHLAGFDEGSICRWESGRRAPSKWMEGRLTAILDRIDAGGGIPADLVPASPSYFDRTRWRRTPPTASSSSEPQSFGDRLRQWRLDRGLTQAQLGRRLGVGRGTVYRWERGESSPLQTRRTALEHLLGDVT